MCRRVQSAHGGRGGGTARRAGAALLAGACAGARGAAGRRAAPRLFCGRHARGAAQRAAGLLKVRTGCFAHALPASARGLVRRVSLTAACAHCPVWPGALGRGVAMAGGRGKHVCGAHSGRCFDPAASALSGWGGRRYDMVWDLLHAVRAPGATGAGRRWDPMHQLLERVSAAAEWGLPSEGPAAALLCADPSGWEPPRCAPRTGGVWAACAGTAVAGRRVGARRRRHGALTDASGLRSCASPGALVSSSA